MHNSKIVERRVIFDLRQIVRFALVGAFNTLFGYCLYLGLLFASLPYWAAWGLSLMISLIVGFSLSGRVVFHDAKRKSLILYLGSWFLIYGLNVVALDFVIGTYLTAEIAPFAILPFNVVASFVLQKTVVFR